MATVADYVIESLAEAGVTDCFVLPGGGAMHLVDALARSERVKPFPMLHEQSVGVAAEAYAQYTNRIGAALVTTGPGGTNVVTAVAAAWCDSTPCIFISGQVKTQDLASERGVRQFGFQEIDIVSIVRPITKYAVLIDSPLNAKALIDEAIVVSRTGRPGPVWIDIPLDIQAAQISDDSLDDVPCSNLHILSPEISNQVETFADALSQAERPIVLLGNGVRLAHAVGEAVHLFSRLQIPMALTWKALDFLPYDHPLNAGRPGSIAPYFANLAIQASDLILTVGARLDLGQLGYRHDTFGPRAKIFVVDVDNAEIEKFSFSSPHVGIPADAGDFLRRLSTSLRHKRIPSTKRWLRRIGEWRESLPEISENDQAWTDGISQYRLIDELSAQMSPEHILVPGSSGACSEVVMQAFRNKEGQRVFNAEGLGPMGFGIPAAIGASVASGARPVVCVDGDGGFAMNIQELATVAFNRMPISFFVLDNNGYGSIRNTANNYFEGRKIGCDSESGLGIPNYLEVAKAFGIHAQAVRDPKSLHRAVREALANESASVTVVGIGALSKTGPRLSSVRRKDGSMATAPLHELSPSIEPLDVWLEINRPLTP